MVLVTEAGPSAFANIHENYYYVFVVCSAFFLVVAYFYFPYVKSYFTLTQILTSPVKPNRKPWKKSLQPLAIRLFWQMRRSGRRWLDKQTISRPHQQPFLNERQEISCQGMCIPGA